MGSATKTISYRYDAARNRTLMIDPEGGRTTYAYDSLDRLTSLINPQGERTTYTYDANGRRTVKELANGTRASFTYDDASQITTLANLRSDNTVISKFDYKYDNVGNRTEVVEADGSRVTWSYDSTYQLTAEHRTGTVPYRNTFTYDSVGNRLLKNETGVRTTYSYDAANQLKTSIDASGITTFTFDPNGNQYLVQTPNNARTTTVWDYENKPTLIQLPTGIRNTMSYEPDGLRAKLEDSTGTKKFIWDNQNYLAESDENDDINVLDTNEPNTYGNLISQHRKSGDLWLPSYYHYEALGSTRQLTNNTQAITDNYIYDAWGNVIASTGTTPNPFQFTGKVGYYFDADTGNQYIRARIYSPIIGRWLSLDPIKFIDGMNLFVAYFIPEGIDASGLAHKVKFRFCCTFYEWCCTTEGKKISKGNRNTKKITILTTHERGQDFKKNRDDAIEYCRNQQNAPEHMDNDCKWISTDFTYIEDRDGLELDWTNWPSPYLGDCSGKKPIAEVNGKGNPDSKCAEYMEDWENAVTDRDVMCVRMCQECFNINGDIRHPAVGICARYVCDVELGGGF